MNGDMFNGQIYKFICFEINLVALFTYLIAGTNLTAMVQVQMIIYWTGVLVNVILSRLMKEIKTLVSGC